VSGEGTSGALSLSFSSLFTGHGGVYTCIATLSVPGAPGVAGRNTIIVIVQSMTVCNYLLIIRFRA
jgi:hypothetical protein